MNALGSRLRSRAALETAMSLTEQTFPTSYHFEKKPVMTSIRSILQGNVDTLAQRMPVEAFLRAERGFLNGYLELLG
jgi:hypothetical protein